MSSASILFFFCCSLIFSCSSQCAYFNEGGIGIPLGYCHTSSSNSSLMSFRWSCDASKQDLMVDVWYDQASCTGSSTYNGNYNDFEDIDKADYSCIGTGAECPGVVLKMYEDKMCQSNMWTKMRLITDHCLDSQNGTSMLVECDATAADAFIYGDTVCSEDKFLQQTSFLESDDKCTKVIACDDPHAISTLKPASTESTQVVSTINDPDSCSYVNLGGTPVPLGYCHEVSTALSKTSYDFSCKQHEIVWTHYSDSKCTNEFYQIEARQYYTIEDFNCGGSSINCDTVELQIYTNPVMKSCSGSLWQTSQYVTNKCLHAADGGSMKYMCTAEVAYVFRYSDENCVRLVNYTNVDDNCYKVLSCKAAGTTTAPHSRSDPSQYKRSHTSAAKTLFTVGVVFTIVVILLVIICTYRRKQQRLEREIAHMTGSVQSARTREPVYANINDNDEKLIGEGLGNPQSEVIVTAYA